MRDERNLGGWHTYCAVSGVHHDAYPQLTSDLARLGAAPTLRLLADEDREAAEDLVLIGSFDADGRELSGFNLTNEALRKINPSTIRLMPSVRPGPSPELGSYLSVPSPPSSSHLQPPPTHYSLGGRGIFLLTQTSLHLLLSYSSLTPISFWALATQLQLEHPDELRGIIPGVGGAYGEVRGAMETFVEPLRCLGERERETGWEEREGWWRGLLLGGSQEVEEVRTEALIGRGNLFVFRRPDRFPISSAFSHPSTPLSIPPRSPPSSSRPTLAHLPPDIHLLIAFHLPLLSLLALSATSTSLRSSLLPYLDALAQRALYTYAPYYLPQARLGERGTEEVEWWNGEVERVGGGRRFPWMAYARECGRSASMWNRRRVWGVVRALEGMGRERGLVQ